MKNQKDINDIQYESLKAGQAGPQALILLMILKYDL